MCSDHADGRCGASRGVLYLVGDEGPFEAASCGEADDALRAVALDCLTDGMDGAESTGIYDSSLARDFRDIPEEVKGELIRPVLLTHEDDEGFVVTGVAVVAISNEVPFLFPAGVARGISHTCGGRATSPASSSPAEGPRDYDLLLTGENHVSRRPASRRSPRAARDRRGRRDRSARG